MIKQMRNSEYKNIIITYSEEKKYTFTNLKTKLNITNKEFTDFKDYLLEKNIIKKDSEKTFKFEYVGILSIKNKIIYVYPKYIQKTDSLETMELIIEVIKKHKNNVLLSNLTTGTFNDVSDLLGLIIFLIDDFIINGLYKEYITTSEISEHGEIYWDKTIQNIQPFIIKEKPIYFEQYTFNNSCNNEHIITKIHHTIMCDIINKFMNSNLNYLFKYNIYLNNIYSIDNLGGFEYLKIVLNRHLNIEFRTREMYLIRLLIIYIDMMNYSNFNFSYQSFGSTNFKNIWETACASVFNKNNILTSMISKPNWNYTNQLKEYNSLEPKGSLLPDIVVINNKQGIETLWILDAKYYIFEIKGQKIFKQPGTSDITKQFFYNIAFLEYAQKNNLDIQNVFLLPTELTTVNKWGYVSFEPILYLNSQLKTSKIKNIQVYLIPAKIIFEKYLKNETIDFLF